MPTTIAYEPGRRAVLSTLHDRLRRIDAAASSLRSLSDARGTTLATLAAALEALERDLASATREAAAVRTLLTTAVDHAPASPDRAAETVQVRAEL